ncbi:MAG: helix-turn-helix transcriptional regulator [Eubacterium sp.]|nr:helix-turn-helix transcriptional regulator [Eubacterium sp.]
MTGITVITTAPAGFFFCLKNRLNPRYPSNALFGHRGEPQEIVAWVQRKTIYRGYPQIKSWKNYTTAELLSEIVVSRRKALNLSQTALSKKANINRSILSRLETRDYSPSVDQLLSLCR